MKKQMLIFCLGLGLFYSCSTEEMKKDCELEVTGMNSATSHGVTQYSVDYRNESGNIVTVEVDEATFIYYRDMFEDSNDHNDCWSGMK